MMLTLRGVLRTVKQLLLFVNHAITVTKIMIRFLQIIKRVLETFKNYGRTNF